MLRRAVQRALAPLGIRQGRPSQLAAAAAAAEAAADRRAASNNNGFEAGADSGTRHSRVPATGASDRCTHKGLAGET
jgi:hypothetical protein